MITLWTDGSASPNPGPGGFAVIEEYLPGKGRPVGFGREDNTTNIRMEAGALLAAMNYVALRHAPAEIHTDSEFWINVLTKWAPVWEKNGWKKKGGEIKNLDLVRELYAMYTTLPVTLVWTRGHVGTEMNELADHWANLAREGKTPF